MLLHIPLKYVPLFPVELGHGERVRLEVVVAPRVEERVGDRLSERWRLQARSGRLDSTCQSGMLPLSNA